MEKIFASLNADGSDWSKKQLAVLSRMSPTSLHVTMKQNELEKQMGLDEALQLEYLIACNLYTNEKSDFFEGVRSVMIAKEKDRPMWKPASVFECDPKEIDSILEKKRGFEDLTF